MLIVAGGIGLCPTRSLIQYILDRRDEFKRFILFYGARDPTAAAVPGRPRRAGATRTDVEYHETVDRADVELDGQRRRHHHALPQGTSSTRDTRVVICGPPIMFQFVIRELDRLGIPRENVFVDLERRMKCGVGKCGHCQINDKYVCVDGPVFSFAEIQNLEEAI